MGCWSPVATVQYRPSWQARPEPHGLNRRKPSSKQVSRAHAPQAIALGAFLPQEPPSTKATQKTRTLRVFFFALLFPPAGFWGIIVRRTGTFPPHGLLAVGQGHWFFFPAAPNKVVELRSTPGKLLSCLVSGWNLPLWQHLPRGHELSLFQKGE